MRLGLIALMVLAAGSALPADTGLPPRAAGGGDSTIGPVVEFGPRVSPTTAPAPSSGPGELVDPARQAAREAFEGHSEPLLELGAPLSHTERPSQAPAVVSGLSARVPKSLDLPQTQVDVPALATQDLHPASAPTTFPPRPGRHKNPPGQ